jgi:O-antigen ligase
LFVAGLGLLYLFNVKKKSKIVIVVPIMFIISFMLFQIVMNVPQFYEILGSRIDSLLSILTGEGNIDASARVRMELIDVGIRLIKQKPFLGYGVASYTNISVKGIYSHNNYIELLVGVGLIGTVIYYSIYFNIILKLLKARKKIVVNLFLTLILLFIFLEFGLVSYFNEIYQLIIAASIPIIKLMSND